MKKVLVGMLALIVVGVLIGQPTWGADKKDQDRAGLVRREIHMPINTLYGCKEVGIYKDSLNQSPSSNIFTLPAVNDPWGYFLTVGFIDTVKAAANVTDSLTVRLCRWPDGYTEIDTTTDLYDMDGWATVYEFTPKLAWATNFPQTKHIPPDSGAVYPIGAGTYKWIVFGGGVQTDHYARKGYKLVCFVEYDPKADE